MRRTCDCAGGCGPRSEALTRREFIGLVGAGSAAAFCPQPGAAAEPHPPEDLARWKEKLLGPAAPRLYRSQTHGDARLHLGGIGTGNFEIGADGQLTTWQLFNTLRDGTVLFHFAVKAGRVVKSLQTVGGPDVPRVKQIEMTGDYPVAFLRFLDPDLPVELELEAFSPFAPLATQVSSVPVAAFVFKLSNRSAKPLEIALAAFLQNPVGYDALGTLAGARHPDFGGNVNEPLEAGRAHGILLRATPGQEPRLDRPVTLFVGANLASLNGPPPDRPKNLAVEALDRLPRTPATLADPEHTVVWLEDAPAEFSEADLRAAREAVHAGATLLFAGKSMPLLAAYAQATGGKPLARGAARPDILFEDFEHGYEKWAIEGQAFGAKPASGTLPNQQRVSGFLGHGLVNTYLEGDGTIGKATSQAFSIERDFIRLLVGGGGHSNTQVRLIVDGKVVRAASGRDNERLQPVAWGVREFQGQTARLEIVDENQGGWGHINVDQIEFSDEPANRGVFALLEELLPARFSSVRAAAAPQPGDPNTLAFEGWELREGATEQTTAGGLRLLQRSLRKGKVLLATGPVLDSEQAPMVNARQSAYALLCALVGASYERPRGPLPTAPGFGTLALAALAGRVTVQCECKDPAEAWTIFARQGGFLRPPQAKPGSPTPPGATSTCALASTVTVPANGTVEVPFLLTWHYPNKYNPAGINMGCHYATRWPEARAVMREAAEQFTVWRELTERFRRTIYDTTLPWWLTDCLTSQASILRHVGVVFRIANGDTYGWEGSNGCCQPTCTHVWGYEQSLARLFPDLEREMRRIDFKHQQRADGGVNNRTDVPSPPRPTGEQPFSDGHASCILKAWREALNHPDEAWLRDYWPHVRRAVDYLIARDAAGAGGEPSGVLNDDQWNTYDEALHGMTTFIGTYYLAALRAGEEWARRMGEGPAAERFHGVFAKGAKKLIELCWNGEYFQQHLPDYLSRSGEVGPGCMADQLIGQWWAHQLGLGYLLPREMVQAALRAVFRYNWKDDLTGWKHIPRAFAGAGDKGLIICTWPKGGRPNNVMLYSDEVWTGIEYQVAAHMIYEGMLEEAFAIVKGARDRYDGVPRPPIPRNPWNEIECGGHYARAMSSWSLLLAASGFLYDGPRQALQFTPRVTPAQFKSFFSGPEGWGSLSQTRAGQTQRTEITVVEGRFAVATLTLAPPARIGTVQATVAGQPTEASFKPADGALEVSFRAPVRLAAGQSLAVSLA